MHSGMRWQHLADALCCIFHDVQLSVCTAVRGQGQVHESDAHPRRLEPSAWPRGRQSYAHAARWQPWRCLCPRTGCPCPGRRRRRRGCGLAPRPPSPSTAGSGGSALQAASAVDPAPCRYASADVLIMLARCSRIRASSDPTADMLRSCCSCAGSQGYHQGSCISRIGHLEQRRQLGLDPGFGRRHRVPHDQRPRQRAQQHLQADNVSFLVIGPLSETDLLLCRCCAARCNFGYLQSPEV